MQDRLQGRSILDVIQTLTSRRERGRLQITSGMTEGAVYVDRGELIDAKFGKLTGFQAINALASIHDASFNFDPSVAPPPRSSITQNERRLLQDFFGIGGFQEAEDYAPFETRLEDDPPAQVVPLIEDVPDITELHEPTVNERPSPLIPSFAESTPTHAPVDADASDADEVTLVKHKAPPRDHRSAIGYGRTSGPKLLPAVFVAILLLVTAAVAFALVYRLLQRRSVAPTTVQTSTPADTPQVTNSRETSPSPPAPQVSNSQQSASAVSDLSGNWNVVNTVEKTSYQGYKNMEVGFELAINQTGTEFTGKGQKISENGRSLSGSSRTPISVQGSIDGDKVEATFFESGATRKTSGRFVWRIDRASGRLTGTFASAAARSSGRSAATKRS